MQRILIFGNSGAGKSTLAKSLAERYGYAHLDLDELAWREGVSPPERRPLAQSVAAIVSWMSTHREWVVEGCYSDLLGAAVDDATAMVFLNPGTEQCIANARQRPWEPHKYSSRAAQDANLDMLLAFIREYETRTDVFSCHRHRQLFDAFAGNKIELASNSRAALRDWLESI